MPDLPWEKQKLKLDLAKDKQPLRLDLPPQNSAPRAPAAAQADRLEAAPPPGRNGGAPRFARTQAAARHDPPPDPDAEPWSRLPVDRLRSESGAGWRRLLRVLAIPWAAPRTTPKPGPRAAVSSGGPFAPARRVVEVSAPPAGVTAETVSHAPESFMADHNAVMGPAPSAAGRALIPLSRDGFQAAARARVRWRWLAQMYAWLLGRDASATSRAPVIRDEGATPAAGARLPAIFAGTALPARLAEPAGDADRAARRSPARWRLATRTLLVAGLGVLCGALLTELIQQPDGNVFARFAQWWWARPATQQAAGPAAREPTVPAMAGPARRNDASVGTAAASEEAPGLPEASDAAADPTEPGPPAPSEAAAPAPAPPAPREPDWEAIDAALEAAHGDPGAQDLVRIVRADAQRWDAFYDLGHRLQVQGQLRAAGALYREAARIDPTHAATFYDWGYVLQQLGERAAAIDKYRTAIRLNSRNPYAYYNLGFLLQREGDLEGALAHYRIAAELDLRNPFLYFNWGTLLERQGDIAGAIARYREASRLQPDAPPGPDARVRIAELNARQGGASASN